MFLPSHTRIRYRLQNIKQQIKYDKQNADQEYICLDDRIVTVKDRADAECSKSRPRKYILHNDRSGDQLRDTHSDCHDTRMHGIFQDMFYEDRFLRKSPDICVKNIVLLHIFQHVVPDQTDIC